MATLPIGPEDQVNEIDVTGDGVPDVRVITDFAPQAPITGPVPPPTSGPPFGPFALGEGSPPHAPLRTFARHWRDYLFND